MTGRRGRGRGRIAGAETDAGVGPVAARATVFTPPRERTPMDHRCPDCGVTMEEVEFGMDDAWNAHVRTGEKRTGLLGKLGMNERKSLTTVMCPECGLVRHYAEFEE